MGLSRELRAMGIEVRVLAPCDGRVIQVHRAGDERGPDREPVADPDHREDMNLTDAQRADRNPDGVVFYKVWNGRSRPKMPAFKDKLTKEQVWMLVGYVQSLRAKS